MKNTNIKTDYNVKKFNELSNDEIFELLSITVNYSREKMLKHYSNVPMIDSILYTEKNDLISQAYIYAVKKAEKYINYNAYQIALYCSLESYRKIIDERIGKRIWKGNKEKGTCTCIGRQLLQDDSSIEMKTKTERQAENKSSYIEMKIDIERILDENELSIIEYMKEGYNLTEIAIIKKTNKMDISRKRKAIQKKLAMLKN